MKSDINFKLKVKYTYISRENKLNISINMIFVRICHAKVKYRLINREYKLYIPFNMIFVRICQAKVKY